MTIMETDSVFINKHNCISGMSSHIEALVHPLVLINIADHLTRILCETTTDQMGSLNSNNKNNLILGGVLGVCNGRQLIFVNSFEIALKSFTHDTFFDTPSGKVLNSNAIDWDFFFQRKEQYLEVFKNLELIGWYIAGPQASPECIGDFITDSRLNCDIQHLLYVKNMMHPSDTVKIKKTQTILSESISGHLPSCSSLLSDSVKQQIEIIIASKNLSSNILIQVFEILNSRLLSKNKLESFLLKEIPFQLESGEAERISIQHIATNAVLPSKCSSLFLSGSTDTLLHNSESSVISRSPIRRHFTSINNTLTDSHHVQRSIETTNLQLAQHPLQIGLEHWLSNTDALKQRIDAALLILSVAMESENHFTKENNYFNTIHPRVLRELSTLCHAIYREGYTNEDNNDVQLTSEIHIELLLSQLSARTSAITNCLTNLIESNIILNRVCSIPIHKLHDRHGCLTHHFSQEKVLNSVQKDIHQ